jgi:pimeloyl-ACP methyl ester carboxylesterase
MRLSAGQHFSNVNLDEWDRYARLTFEERDGKIVLRFDPELSHTLDTVERGKAPDTMWEEFDALSGVPVMGIRGGNTDLLSVEIFDEMARRHPDFEQLTVEGHGHAPLLLDTPTIGRIAEFVARQK